MRVVYLPFTTHNLVEEVLDHAGQLGEADLHLVVAGVNVDERFLCLQIIIIIATISNTTNAHSLFIRTRRTIETHS